MDLRKTNIAWTRSAIASLKLPNGRHPSSTMAWRIFWTLRPYRSVHFAIARRRSQLPFLVRPGDSTFVRERQAGVDTPACARRREADVSCRAGRCSRQEDSPTLCAAGVRKTLRARAGLARSHPGAELGPTQDQPKRCTGRARMCRTCICDLVHLWPLRLFASSTMS